MGSSVVAPLLVVMQFLKVLFSALLAYKLLQFYDVRDNARIIAAYLIHPYDMVYYVQILLRFISSNSMGIDPLGSGYYGLPKLSISIVGISFIVEGALSLFSKMKGRKEKIIFFVAFFLMLFVIFVPLGSCIFNAFQYPFGRYTFVILPIFLTGLIVYFVYAFENDKFTRTYEKFIIGMNLCTLILMNAFIGEAIIEGYASTGGYCATLNKNLIRFYEEIWPEAMTNNGTKVTTARSYITDSGKLCNDNILTLLGMKYILAFEEIPDTEGKYRKVDYGDSDIMVYQNTNVNSIITGINKVIIETEFEKFSHEDRNRIIKSYLVLPDEEAMNSSYYADSVDMLKLDAVQFDNDYLLTSTKVTYYQGTVDVENDKLLLFAIPYRQGWNIYIDENKAEHYKADYGFIACEVSQGNHTIEFKYENKIYLAGIVCTRIGLMVWGDCLPLFFFGFKYYLFPEYVIQNYYRYHEEVFTYYLITM